MRKPILTGVIGVFTFVSLLWANRDGAQPRKTGGPFPSESVCTECHSGGLPNRDPSGSVDFSVQNYRPGETQRITVTVSHPTQVRWGFQLTARPASNLEQQAGTFRAINADAWVNCDKEEIPAPCPAGMLQFPTHTLSGTRRGTRNSASFTVEWTAPSSDVGEIIFATAGNAANGSDTETGDLIYTKQVRISAGATVRDLNPRISQNGVVVAGLSSPPVRAIAANGIVSIFGQDFYPAGQQRLVSGSDLVNGRLPENLDGVCVEIGGQKARMFHVFPGQLNVQAPSLTATGQMNVVVIVNCGISGSERPSAAEPVNVQTVSPDFFYFRGSDNRPRVAAINAVTFAAITSAAKPGDILALYVTGLGRTEPFFEAGVLPDKIGPTVTPVTVTVGGTQAEVLYAGVAPGLAGLYQINIRLPEVPNGDQPVVARIGGSATPEGPFLSIQR